MFQIRNTFELEELPALYVIECECFEPAFRWSERSFKKTMIAAKAKNNVWVATLAGKIAGFLIAGTYGKKALIETVNITRYHRRKGVATKLIQACEVDSKKLGFAEIQLEVWTENPAQLLYFTLGYRVSGFKRNYYKLNTHAVSMAKKL